MNANTKLCAICLAAGVQVVASQNNECGDVCEFCFKGELHPAVKDKETSIARSPVQAAKLRGSRWDAKVFDVLRIHPNREITITLPSHERAEDAASCIRTLNRCSRKVAGLLVSVRGPHVVIWIDRDGAKVERRGGVRFERREAAL